MRRLRPNLWATVLGVALTIMALGPAMASAADAAPELPEGFALEVGQEAPDFTLEASSGTTYRLADQRGEKNVVLVFFRGTW